MYRPDSYLDQLDEEDNLLSMKMIYDFIDINAKAEKPVMYGKDVELYTVLNGDKYTLSGNDN